MPAYQSFIEIWGVVLGVIVAAIHSLVKVWIIVEIIVILVAVAVVAVTWVVLMRLEAASFLDVRIGVGVGVVVSRVHFLAFGVLLKKTGIRIGVLLVE